MNVFAAEPPQGTSKFWDRVCGEADSPKMVQKRRHENEVAIAMSGAHNEQVYLDYLDNQYRSSHPTPTELADTIEAKSPPDAVYYAPLAMSRLYRHPDHVLARQAGLILHTRGLKLGFYPDAPYMNLAQRPREASLKRMKALAEKTLGLKVSININELEPAQQQAKNEALHAYKTQYKMTNLESFGGLTRVMRRPYEVVVRAI